MASLRGGRSLALVALLGAAAAAARDSPSDVRRAGRVGVRSACEGARSALPAVLSYELAAGAFPGSGHADVAVHVPPGFDAARRPGLVLYLHGWNGCVQSALADQDVPCTDGGAPRPAARLAAQLDAARVNAVLVAVELRVDRPSGEPGRLAMPGDAHELLRELFTERMAEPLGCAVEVDAFDPIVLIAHSGGYQAAASALKFGDLPHVREVVLLDSLYGAENVFADWLSHRPDRARLVDLYTAAGGTLARSRAMAGRTLADPELRDRVYDDDTDAPLDPAALVHPIVFKRVPLAHAELPRAYVRPLLEAAGFAPLDSF
jgi:hypothetical protein